MEAGLSRKAFVSAGSFSQATAIGQRHLELGWTAVRDGWLALAARTVLSDATPFDVASLRAPKAADVDEIRTDLDRSGCAAFGVQADLAAAHRDSVRRVLQAWCALRPDIGYCQGMNLLAGATVRVCGDAPDAFALYALLLSCLPAAGVVVEVGALWHLLATRSPHRFGKGAGAAAGPLREAVGLVALQWLCPLWAGVLPLDQLIAAWGFTLGLDGCDRSFTRGRGARGGEPTGMALQQHTHTSILDPSVRGGNLRIALALIEGAPPDELRSAALADAAAGDGGGGQAYNVFLRRAAAIDSATAASLLVTARAIVLSGAEVLRARAAGAAELQARRIERRALSSRDRLSARLSVWASAGRPEAGGVAAIAAGHEAATLLSTAFVCSTWRSGLYC
jgi:hypothetical protein